MEVLAKWIYRELKIDLSAYKSNQMSRRLTSFMSRSGQNSASEYIKILDRDPELKKKLKDFITINVSEFFRNKDLFMELQGRIKENLLSRSDRIKVWSAACSNGSEPYTVAIILDRLTPGKRHTIIGTDIDDTILCAARNGVYTENDVKNVDKQLLDKYFKRDLDKYLLCEDIKSRVQFKKHDLILDRYDRGFDLILCRNVVIYFTQEVKDSIYRKFSDSLNSGGLLFVGATESIYNYKDYGFDKVSTFIYTKK